MPASLISLVNADAPPFAPPRTAPSESVYLNDARETAFFLWELQEADQWALGAAPFEAVDRTRVEDILARARTFAAKLGRAYQEADRSPAHLDADGEVVIPRAFAALWEEFLRDWHWLRLQTETVSQERPGLPQIVNQMIFEMFVGANPAFMTYGGFTPSALFLMGHAATPEQRALFEQPLAEGRWDACFCATEDTAGSDLSDVRTHAEPLQDGVYAVSGVKRFITAGMNPLVENTVYLVIGRVADAKPGFFSLSCFLVPRFWPEADGSLTDNFVRCTRVEDKMGLNGCANTQLAFGCGGVTRGTLLGGRKNVALLQLQPLIRRARIGTGQIALGLASSAYLHSLRFARRRVQGRRFEEASNVEADQVPIIEHLDVQRMLLEMRASVEGCRSLIGRLTREVTKVQQMVAAGLGKDDMERSARLILLYTPMVKAYVSDEAWKVASQAIQVHGGVGYLRDNPVEQYCRDIRVLSIWEGTNYIQAQDLVREKLGLGRQALAMRYFTEDVEAFLARGAAHPNLAAEFALLEAGLRCLTGALEAIQRHVVEGRIALIPQICTRFLAIFGDVAAGWGLLEAACVAERALSADKPDPAFYRGKVKTARFFARNTLSGLPARAALIHELEDVVVRLDADEFGFADGGAET
ncbi:acyl-CoA dehydrogenase [Caulobacter sp. Root487D2Y]|uniref:acyl-CoA dehydrogenase n=1 Tax=Caulobacter sp. Root487D2Y TaxID=1736547 RepID=UPI000B0C7E95|nr:acyl-CoA dehydrogenase [Caulobacter sp. Root487D2Y]